MLKNGVRIRIAKGLLVITIIACIFTITASAGTRIHNLKDDDGHTIARETVKIRDDRNVEHTGVTDGYGNFETTGTFDYANDHEYSAYDNSGKKRGSRHIGQYDWRNIADDKETDWVNQQSNIPEFPSIALPIAAVIGIVFLFQHRKNREE